jgi:protein phosphatase
MKIELYHPLYIYEVGQRNNQEDAIYPKGDRASKDNRLFILCDGMGGHERGEVASNLVSISIPHFLERTGVLFEDHFDDDILNQSLEYAYQQLDREKDDSQRQMGTTLTLLYIHNKGITAAHMGDSRIYHIRPGKGILYQSRDHSIAFDLFQSGEITYEEMLNYPHKNVVTRAMVPGEENRMRPDIIHITEILPDDYFYLCSDGMMEQMNNDELVAILTSRICDDEKRQQLIVKSANNQDNHSAWLIHVKNIIHDEGDKQQTNEELTARCNAINIKPPTIFEKEVYNADNEDDVVIVKEKPRKKSLMQHIHGLIRFTNNKEK